MKPLTTKTKLITKTKVHQSDTPTGPLMPRGNMGHLCATRALKNAKVIRKAASHIIPPREPLEGFRSLVPLDILKRFHRMSEADLRDYP